MEKKEKLSRLASLQKLKNRRNKIVESDEEVNEVICDEVDSVEEYSDNDDNMKDFIEEDEEEKDKDSQSQFYNRRNISKFFRTDIDKLSNNIQSSSKASSVDKYNALKEDFFKNLVAQLSDDEESTGGEKEQDQHDTNEPIPSETTGKGKRKAKEEGKRSRKEPKTKANESDAETEFIPPSEMTIAFPEPAPGSSLNQLEINNAKAMEIDEEDEDHVEFPDEADLQQFEEEMSFIIENTTAPVKLEITSTPQVQICAAEQLQLQNSEKFSQKSFGLVASAEDFLENDKDASCLVYWFDAYEKQPNGPVYLFGKMKDSKSSTGVSTCCVIVQNIERNIFFLPRETSTDGQEVTFDDLQAEVSQIASQYGISKFECKPVSRKYAFELPDVPAESEYLKMTYPFDSCPQLPLGLSGKNFSQVFGTNTSALEMLLVKRKIMGPCWLKIKPSSITGRAVSWCKTELTVTDSKQINPLQPSDGKELPHPPLMTAMSLSLRTIMNPETKAHEIVAISGLIYDSVDVDGSRSTAADRPQCSAAFTVVRDLENAGFSNRFSSSLTVGPNNIRVEQAKNEKALLNYFIAMLQRHDPDILVGHNFLGFDLGVLLHRMKACKTDFWSKMGRLNWTQWPKSKAGAAFSTEASYAERQVLCGRIVCDTYLAAKDLIKAKNYSLGTLAESQLGLQRTPFDYERIKDYFETPELLRQMLSGSEMDAYYIAMLMFQMLILPLTLQLTTIAGNLWSRTLTGARAERNEFLLLHEFHNQKYICPDKQPYSASMPAFTIGQSIDDEVPENNGKKATTGRRKPAYSGGLVLEPKKGFYDRIVLLLDFNSLYPSIIQEYNICFTTVERGENSKESSEEVTGGDLVPPVPDSALPQGVLPRILKTLVERRRAVKSMMKKDSKLTASQMASLNIRQQALKLTANSMYGCLGFSHSRFYAKPLAILITSKGREILQNTVNLTREACQSDVIYGDTDSIMVNTRSNSLQEARALGQKIKKAVNERYRLLEIELDGIFQKLLLLKKKKYAALIVEEEKADGTVTTRLETKGLDLVRRDWCELSVDASTRILDEIMRGEGSGEEIAQIIHESLRKVAKDLEESKIPLEKFIISKNLTKEPSSYADARTQPHVTVALRMRQKGLSASSGDTIPYVICQQSSAPIENNSNSTTLADFAYHPDEVRKDGTLRLDVSWYLQTQLHPPIARLCEHIEGTDSSQLAACLGLDPRKFRSSSNSSNSDDSLLNSSASSRFASLLTDEERFAHVEKLKIVCPSCSSHFEFAGIIKEEPESLSSLLNCAQCSAPLSVTSLYYAAILSLRKASDNYNSFWMKCDEVGCQLETERLGVYDRRCPSDGCKGVLRPRLPHSYLYTHLLYLRSLFSTEKIQTRLANKLTPADTKLLQHLAAVVEPVTTFIDQKMQQCAYPVISFKQIFGFLHGSNEE